MIHYHGTPLTPESAAASVFAGRHAMVSFAHPDQLPLVAEVCQSFALDNGAFSAWRSGKPITDWLPFRGWIDEWARHPACDWFLIPDVIDGDEHDNDNLIFEFREVKSGVPIWHLHESITRIDRLMEMGFDRIAIGSSGEFATIKTSRWWSRMAEAMKAVCDCHGRPYVKLHGLRMLDPDVFGAFPFASADSTNVARNVGLDTRWRGTYAPTNKATRGLVLANRIEAYQSAAVWTPHMIQEGLELYDPHHQLSSKGDSVSIYDYEDWDVCDKHRKLHPCPDCRIESERREHQKRHEESVARQRNQLKIAPWRTK